jgi:hypothetical protein
MITSDNAIGLMCREDACYWAYYNNIMLQGGVKFDVRNHAYQRGMMRFRNKGLRKKVTRKGGQVAATESAVLSILHGMIMGKYPRGVAYYWPTESSISKFSRARFGPLIQQNPVSIGKYVKDTDSTEMKSIAGAMLYFFGAKLTQMISGVKKDSPNLRGYAVDRTDVDEVDLVSQAALDMIAQRLSHSDVQEAWFRGTPTIPGMGSDAMYEDSTQGIWEIKCSSCGRYTCLEKEFPRCFRRVDLKTVKRVCIHCGAEIYPKDGEWHDLFSDREMEGEWISQFNSMYVSPDSILKWYESGERLQEFYNQVWGLGYIEVEDRLSIQDVLNCCGQDSMGFSDIGPCAMGADIGLTNHVVVIKKKTETQYKMVFAGTVKGFDDLPDIATRYNVMSEVDDLRPYEDSFRKHQAAAKHKVFGCYYPNMRMKVATRVDESGGIIAADRTELCDRSHKVLRDRMIELPRKNDKIEEFAVQCANIAKSLQIDEDTDDRIYRYVGKNDHYRHALNYALLAADGIPTMQNEQNRNRKKKEYNPLTYTYSC